MIEKFISFEKEMDLFELEAVNIKYWEMIRVEIYNAINNFKNNIPKSHSSKVYQSKKRILKVKLRQFLNTFNKNPYFFLKPKDVMVFNHPRKTKKNDFYYGIYTSELIDNLDYNYYIYEIPYNEGHFASSEMCLKYTDNIINRYLIKRLKNKLINKLLLNNKEKNEIIELVKLLNEKFDVSLEAQYWIKKINNKILYFLTAYKAYNKIISKIQPKVIIQVVSYLNSRFVVNYIAKEKGIPTIELQHGTMGKYHIAYNFSEKMKLNTFPDYIFTFGDYWKENTRFPIPASKVISVGWPFYENKVKKFNKKTSVNNNKTILFISQGLIGNKLSQFAVEFSNKLNSNSYRVIYKLHPGEYDIWKEQYPDLINNKIEVIDNSDYDMHYYLQQADIQIGVSSTALFEGIGYGLQTYIVKLYSHWYMKDLYNNNYATLVENTEKLLEQIKYSSNKNVLQIEYFWKSNSLNNMVNEINKIVKTHNC